MPKGNWREFDEPSISRSSSSQFIENESARNVYVQRTRVGKGGKTVTVISGLKLEPKAAKSLLKNLKTRCGSGGTLRGELIELQGDQVIVVMDLLEGMGYLPKKSGG